MTHIEKLKQNGLIELGSAMHELHEVDEALHSKVSSLVREAMDKGETAEWVLNQLLEDIHNDPQDRLYPWLMKVRAEMQALGMIASGERLTIPSDPTELNEGRAGTAAAIAGVQNGDYRQSLPTIRREVDEDDLDDEPFSSDTPTLLPGDLPESGK